MEKKECILKARAVTIRGLQGRAVEIFVVGKWRVVANAGTKGLPSIKTAEKAIRTVMFNTGSYDSFHDPYYRTQFNPNKGTFKDKNIVLEWVQIDNLI